MKQTIPNYISQDEEETPAQNTWSRKHIQRTITQEEILVTMEKPSSVTTACQFSSIKSQRQLFCDFENAVMDADIEILQYYHLMAHPEYSCVGKIPC